MLSRRKLIRLAAPALLLGAAPKLVRAQQIPLSGWFDPLVYPAGRAPGFDPSHIAGTNVIFSGVARGANFVNILNGKRGTPTAITAANTSIGPGANPGANGSGGVITFSGMRAVADANMTFAGIGMILANGANQQLLVSNSTSGGIQFGPNTNSGALVYTFTAVAADSFSFTGFSFASNGGQVGVPFFAAASNNASGGAAVLRRLDTGQLFSTTTFSSNTQSAPNGTYQIGCATNGTSQFNGAVAAVMTSYNFTPLATLQAWSQNPWDFWYPPDALMAELVGSISATGLRLLPLTGVGN